MRLLAKEQIGSNPMEAGRGSAVCVCVCAHSLTRFIFVWPSSTPPQFTIVEWVLCVRVWKKGKNEPKRSWTDDGSEIRVEEIWRACRPSIAAAVSVVCVCVCLSLSLSLTHSLTHSLIHSLTHSVLRGSVNPSSMFVSLLSLFTLSSLFGAHALLALHQDADWVWKEGIESEWTMFVRGTQCSLTLWASICFRPMINLVNRQEQRTAVTWRLKTRAEKYCDHHCIVSWVWYGDTAHDDDWEAEKIEKRFAEIAKTKGSCGGFPPSCYCLSSVP